MATAKKAQGPPAPRIKTIRASEVKPEEIEYLWLDRIPKGAFTLIGGRPGEGKSLFTNYLAAEVTRNGGAVVMSNPEDALAWVKVPRLLAAKADTRLIHFWPGKISLPDDVGLLEELILFHGVELVTIDPIAKHIKGRDPNTALEPLAAMAERTGCAIVGVHHINKRMPKDAHPRDAFGGANGGWIGTARFAHILGPAASGDEGTRFLSMVKSNHAPDDVPSVEMYIDAEAIDLPNGDVTETARLVFVNDKAKVTGSDVVQYQPGGGYKHQAGGEKLEAAKEAVTLWLAKGPVKAQTVYDLAATHGLSKMTVRRAADDLGVVKKRKGFGEDGYFMWSLPADHPFAKTMGAPSVPAPASEDGEDGDDVDGFIKQVLGDGS